MPYTGCIVIIYNFVFTSLDCSVSMYFYIKMYYLESEMFTDMFLCSCRTGCKCFLDIMTDYLKDMYLAKLHTIVLRWEKMDRHPVLDMWMDSHPESCAFFKCSHV